MYDSLWTSQLAGGTVTKWSPGFWSATLVGYLSHDQGIQLLQLTEELTSGEVNLLEQVEPVLKKVATQLTSLEGDAYITLSVTAAKINFLLTRVLPSTSLDDPPIKEMKNTIATYVSERYPLTVHHKLACQTEKSHFFTE